MRSIWQVVCLSVLSYVLLAVGSTTRAEENNSVTKTVTINENGKKVTVSETDKGITVSTTEMVNGKEKKVDVKAASASELKRKNPTAFRQYEKAMNGNSAIANANGGNLNGKDFNFALNGNGDAKAMMKEQIQKMIQENAGNPQLKSLLEEMLQKINEAK